MVRAFGYNQSMKILIIVLLLPLITFAQYQKPQLLTRFAAEAGWNAPPMMFCFSSEPLVTSSGVYLGCMDQQGGQGMVEWSPQFKVTAVARANSYFSLPRSVSGKVTWTEFEEWGTTAAYVLDGTQLTRTELKGLNPSGEPHDSFLSLGQGEWIYRLKSYSGYQIWSWQQHMVKPIFTQPVSHIFPPVVGEQGELVIKTREVHNNESAPDRLWMYRGEAWHLLLEDRDANPASPWISFRHQMSVEGERVLLVARDEQGDALVLLERGRWQEIARVGRDLKEIDYFTPKLKQDTIVFRGVDLAGKKGLWAHTGGQLQRLLQQGELIDSDLGPARVDYPRQHAIFYGAPGIGPEGEIIQQATLTDPADLNQLWGIGLLKFSRQK
jgi:hypothetical protein